MVRNSIKYCDRKKSTVLLKIVRLAALGMEYFKTIDLRIRSDFLDHFTGIVVTHKPFRPPKKKTQPHNWFIQISGAK